MVKEIWVIAKNEKIKEAIKKYFPSASYCENIKEINNLNGLIFVNIKDFGVIPFHAKKGIFPIAVIEKSVPKTNLASLIMKTMSKNYFDSIEYPFEKRDLEKILDTISYKENDENNVIYLKNKEPDETVLCQYLCSIIGSSPELRSICKLAGEVAPTDLPVLITGETGTGKELLARGIWKLSNRSDKPFIAINCASIPEDLLESELFGYEKGAFTGADKQKKGKFELADRGTIFLDEIGELPLASQSKLLRVLQEGTFYRVGGEKEIKVDVRIIAATNRNLEQMVKKGKFREDLYYRLNIIHLYLPPLRERKGDIPYIVECIIKKYNKRLNKEIIGFSKEYIDKLKRQKWKGNIRELENTVIRSMILCRDNILTITDLDFLKEEQELNNEVTNNVDLEEALKNYIKLYVESNKINELEENIEKTIIKTVLEYTRYNLSRSAELLNINRATLRRKLRKYNIWK